MNSAKVPCPCGGRNKDCYRCGGLGLMDESKYQTNVESLENVSINPDHGTFCPRCKKSLKFVNFNTHKCVLNKPEAQAKPTSRMRIVKDPDLIVNALRLVKEGLDQGNSIIPRADLIQSLMKDNKISKKDLIDLMRGDDWYRLNIYEGKKVDPVIQAAKKRAKNRKPRT